MRTETGFCTDLQEMTDRVRRDGNVIARVKLTYTRGVMYTHTHTHTRWNVSCVIVCFVAYDRQSVNWH